MNHANVRSRQGMLALASHWRVIRGPWGGPWGDSGIESGQVGGHSGSSLGTSGGGDWSARPELPGNECPVE